MAMAKTKTVEYSAYNFDTGEYNCTTYLGHPVYQGREELAGAQEEFERAAPNWHLVELRSKCTVENGGSNVCQIVALNKETNQIITSDWVLRSDGCSAAYYAQDGLNCCAYGVRRYSGFRGSVVAALEFAAMNKQYLPASSVEVETRPCVLERRFGYGKSPVINDLTSSRGKYVGSLAKDFCARPWGVSECRMFSFGIYSIYTINGEVLPSKRAAEENEIFFPVRKVSAADYNAFLGEYKKDDDEIRRARDKVPSGVRQQGRIRAAASCAGMNGLCEISDAQFRDRDFEKIPESSFAIVFPPTGLIIEVYGPDIVPEKYLTEFLYGMKGFLHTDAILFDIGTRRSLFGVDKYLAPYVVELEKLKKQAAENIKSH